MSRLYCDTPSRDPIALNFKFRADKRITQKTLDEARQWALDHIGDDQEKELQ